VLIQLAVPSRQGVEEYAKLQHEVEFLHRSMPFAQLCALYSVGDGCIVSSLRGGLNLVSYEFVASQASKSIDSQKGPGMLLLSQYTGPAAHTQLRSGPDWSTPPGNGNDTQ
jgi:trehalose 6-phosphate synthase